MSCLSVSNVKTDIWTFHDILTYSQMLYVNTRTLRARLHAVQLSFKTMGTQKNEVAAIHFGATDADVWCKSSLNRPQSLIYEIDFEAQGRHRKKSKTGASVAPQKDLCPPNIFKKTKRRYCLASWITSMFTTKVHLDFVNMKL